MKLSMKLILLSTILMLFSISISTISLYRMTDINNKTQELSTNWLPSMKLAAQLNLTFNGFRRFELVHILLSDPVEMKRYESIMDGLQIEFNKLLNEYHNHISEIDEGNIYIKLEPAWNKYLSIHSEIIYLSNKQEDELAKQKLLGDGFALFSEITSYLDSIVSINNRGGDLTAKSAKDEYEVSKIIVISMLITSTLIAALLSFIIIRSVLIQLGHDPNYLKHIASEISNGNLNIQFDPISRTNTVYSTLISMVDNLKSKIKDAELKTIEAENESKKAKEMTELAKEATIKAENAEREGRLNAANKLEAIISSITNSISTLSAQIEQVSKGSIESSYRLSEAATAMNEMNSTVQEVAQNASLSAELSNNTKVNAEQGAQIVINVVDSIDAVQKSSLILKDNIKTLNIHSVSITSIMDVISDIADQTNLLALNAAIEAARAGDAGRGFAVVADEVRKLAEKTLNSTKDVSAAIAAIQNSSNEILKNMDESIVKVNSATDLANQSGTALKTIVHDAEISNDQIRAIATASEEQSAASEEINHSIINGEMVNETTNSMSSAMSALKDLNIQSENLNKLILSLKSV